ncbi:hypothetical protein MIND_00922600 [Mycena indigotica]|uniref:Abscisic acid G-protein coupled receptor-like domain-containing protein n=1 Tax=Mycena indigotica TaxID=2126181 RepID=A0A8H6SCG5_9AGAR|nr:uncharacterized protein MIND_00922600 [Mycena indigotica]KAF7296908.1 hypothetical protein MIND_00922600 [Mycena indigotica]
MLAETVALVALRAAIFFSCRKFILAGLHANYQDSDTEFIPLQEPLPSPITHSSKGKSFGKSKATTEAGDVFAGCFMESCVLCTLLMMQALDISSPSVRLLNWRISLFILLALVLLYLPFLLSLLLIFSTDSETRHRTTLPRLAFSVAVVGLHLFLLSLVPLPEPAGDYTTAVLSRLIVVGTVILGLLAGYGAASSVWTYFPLNGQIIPPTENELVSAQEGEAGRRRAESAAAAQANATWLSRVMPSFRGDDDTQVLAGLSALEEQMTIRVDTLRQRRLEALRMRTWYGRLVTICGRVFSVYCAFRVLTTMAAFLLPSSFGSRTTSEASKTSPALDLDLATNVMTTLLPPLADKPQLASRLARHASLLLVGIIIASSLRRVVRGATRVLRVTSQTLGSALMVLVLAWVMSVYILATIVQLRTTFPPPTPSTPPSEVGNDDAAVTNLFSTIPPFARDDGLAGKWVVRTEVSEHHWIKKISASHR